MKKGEFCSGLYSKVPSGGLNGWDLRKTYLELEKCLIIAYQPFLHKPGANLGEYLAFVNLNNRKPLLNVYLNPGFMRLNPNLEFKRDYVKNLSIKKALDQLIFARLFNYLVSLKYALIEMSRLVKPARVNSINPPYQTVLKQNTSIALV